MLVQGVSGVQGGLQGLAEGAGAVQEVKGKSFKDVLASAIHDVDHLQHASDDKLQMLATGEETDIHGTMIAIQEADISIRLLMSVRNKVLEAYNQVMNMNL